MRYTQAIDQRLDIIIGARILNGCWLVTNVGISIFQMRLLALAWQQSHLAAWTAWIASAWIIGSILISHLDPRQQQSARHWAVSFVVCALACSSISHVLKYIPFPQPLSVVMSICALATLAFLMGMISTGWLAQRRPWPLVDERISLVKGLLSTMVGLWVVWALPQWVDALGLLCISALFVLDFWPAGQCPLPLPGKFLDNWYDSTQGADSWRLQLRKHGAWLCSYLAQRERLALIFLASSISILLGSIWSAIPTAFAASLLAIHKVDLLGWLVLSQLVALVLGTCGLIAARGVMGTTDRLIPQAWRGAIWCIAIGGLFLMAAGLLALGIPAFQSPWSLAASMAVYTLGAATWSMLLPRLKPGFTTLVFSQRHLLPNTQLLKSQLAYERAQEEHAGRLLATTEGMLIAILAPGLGWLVDRSSVDSTLIIAGLFLLAFLSITLPVIDHSRGDGLFGTAWPTPWRWIG